MVREEGQDAMTRPTCPSSLIYVYERQIGAPLNSVAILGESQSECV